MVRAMTMVLAMTAAGTAFAGDKTVEPKVVYQSVSEVDFEVVDVDGKVVKPTGVISMERAKAHFPSFIRLRAEWKQEMAQSVNDVK